MHCGCPDARRLRSISVLGPAAITPAALHVEITLIQRSITMKFQALQIKRESRYIGTVKRTSASIRRVFNLVIHFPSMSVAKDIPRVSGRK